MPKRLRPTAPIAADAILVGDPGRALLLAQELLEQPKMSNHARGLWGYWGKTPAGRELTVQATGMGGPSAVLVLEDLVELGVRRVVRVGTCLAGASASLGDLVVASGALAASGERVAPEPALSRRLGAGLTKADALSGEVASFDSHPGAHALPRGSIAADMQTAPLLAAARGAGVAAAAVLVVAEAGDGSALEKERLEDLERVAGRAAAAALSA